MQLMIKNSLSGFEKEIQNIKIRQQCTIGTLLSFCSETGFDAKVLKKYADKSIYGLLFVYKHTDIVVN